MTRAAFLLLPAVLLVLIIPQLRSGIPHNRTYPIPDYISIEHMVPRSAYVETAGILAAASPWDGRTMVTRAIALYFSGAEQAEFLPLLQAGLAKSPAYARGWILYAEALRKDSPQRAMQALDLARVLGRHEYWLSIPFARAAAPLLDSLPPQTREHAFQQARYLWLDSALIGEFSDLLRQESGARLVFEAFREQPGQLEEIKKWVSRKRREEALSGR
jgi:hypothetical protein